jgi:hypothetical protein
MVKEANQPLYGTQVRLVDGKCEPLPLKDPARVDELRKSVGLPPLRDYSKIVEELYAKPAPDDGTK